MVDSSEGEMQTVTRSGGMEHKQHLDKRMTENNVTQNKKYEQFTYP